MFGFLHIRNNTVRLETNHNTKGFCSKSLLFISCILSYAIPATITIPTEYATIQAGIDASVDGDTVLVQPGTYYETINFIGKEILLTSFILTTNDTNYIDYTIIDGNQEQSSVVTFNYGEDSLSIIRGFTIRNGLGNNADPDMDGTFADYGGGIYCENSSPKLEFLIIKQNTVLGGGGGGIFCFDSSPIIFSTKIIDNYSNDVGGGIYLKLNSNPTLIYVIISENYGAYGGGLYARDTCEISANNLIFDNNFSSNASAFLVKEYSSLSMENGVITNSSSSIKFICNNSSSVILDNCLINEDQTGSIMFSNMSTFILKNSVINGNTGIELGNSNANFINSTITGNVYINSGSSPIQLIESTIINNTLEWDIGIIRINNSILTINKSTFTQNVSPVGLIQSTNSEVNIYNTILWNDNIDEIYIDTTSNYSTTTTNLYYCNIEGGITGITNHYLSQFNHNNIIDLDPQFDPTNTSGIVLSPNSPCIDNGIQYYNVNGDTLFYLNDTSFCGSHPDIGVFEYCQPVSLANDAILPRKIVLKQNHPNPFNPTTLIRYDLPEDAFVSITVYDLLGRQIINLVNDDMTAGYRSALWNGNDSFGRPVSSGMYIYQIQAGSFIQSKKMVLLK